MRVAVMSLTRDRLDFTKHCFQTLRDCAGIDFDHYVLDQGSTDGSPRWLAGQPLELHALTENIGISRGLNLLLDEALNPMDYDVLVKADNDLELTMENTLLDICKLVDKGGAILSPRILGLQNPPAARGELLIGDEVILDIPQIGGVFLAAPAWVYDEFRFNPDNPYWGMDDVQVCAWFRSRGGTCGYVNRLEAWHYSTTEGQQQLEPDYFARKTAEMAAR